MEADVLNALRSRAAYFTGGRDRRGRWLIYVPVPAELRPWTKRNCELAIAYLLATMSEDATVETATDTSDSPPPTTVDDNATERPQFVLLVDTQRCSARIARSTLRHIESCVAVKPDGPLVSIVVVRTDAFWDKQLVDNCTKTINSGHSSNASSSSSSNSSHERRDEVSCRDKHHKCLCHSNAQHNL